MIRFAALSTVSLHSSVCVIPVQYSGSMILWFAGLLHFFWFSSLEWFASFMVCFLFMSGIVSARMRLWAHILSGIWRNTTTTGYCHAPSGCESRQGLFRCLSAVFWRWCRCQNRRIYAMRRRCLQLAESAHDECRCSVDDVLWARPCIFGL